MICIVNPNPTSLGFLGKLVVSHGSRASFRYGYGSYVKEGIKEHNITQILQV